MDAPRPPDLSCRTRAAPSSIRHGRRVATTGSLAIAEACTRTYAKEAYRTRTTRAS
jgi:hypothetical protein